jgi:hypothetical protein
VYGNGPGNQTKEESMKKPMLAAAGVAGACAACCAVPLALPLVSGLAASGLLGWGWMERIGPMVGLGAIGLAVAVVTVAIALRARRAQAAPACGVTPGEPGGRLCGSSAR